MELFLPYIIMYLLFSILLMYIFQIIGKNSFLAFIPLYSMYIALKFFKGRIYYRNWGNILRNWNYSSNTRNIYNSWHYY